MARVRKSQPPSDPSHHRFALLPLTGAGPHAGGARTLDRPRPPLHSGTAVQRAICARITSSQHGGLRVLGLQCVRARERLLGCILMHERRAPTSSAGRSLWTRDGYTRGSPLRMPQSTGAHPAPAREPVVPCCAPARALAPGRALAPPPRPPPRLRALPRTA